MNADIRIPVISPLYTRLTNGSRCTALDAICLLLAIPSTLVYREMAGNLPKDDKGYQELVKAGAMKRVLDLRMGRIKGSVLPGMPADASAPTQTMLKARLWWDEVGKHASRILKVCLPMVSALYTAGYKLPMAIAAGDAAYIGGEVASQASKAKGSSWKVMFKLVLWIGHGAVICLPRFKGSTKDFGVLAKAAFTDVVFGWKFVIWSTAGFLPVVAHMIHSTLGHCMEAVAGVAQTVTLLMMHIDVYLVAKVPHMGWKCPEDYINALAETAIAVFVSAQGKEPWSLGFVFGLTAVGKTWTFVRTQSGFGAIRRWRRV